jgi:cellulose synthase/poly-beta-1,6-N-acetylglucosamine synthase-like glycosyltransferase
LVAETTGATRVIFQVLWFLVLAHIVITWALAVRLGTLARRAKLKPSIPSEEELPPVSVIVPAWNEKGTIEKHIAALRRVEYPCWEAIILAGGEDGTQAAALQAAAGVPHLHILERGPEPKNAALNRGILHAQYNIVVLLDADNMVTPGWLKALMAPIAQGASVAVGDSLPNRQTWVTLEERMWHIHTYHILKMSWIQGDRSIAIRRELLERIGGLPEHTYAREDWDIWARLGETGERVAFAEGASLTTDRPATLKESWKHQLRWRRTHLNGLWEHRRKLLRQPADLLMQLYEYLLSLGLAVLILATVVTLLIWPATARAVVHVPVMVLVWLSARRAAVAGEVAAYTGEARWLGRAWMPAVNIFLTIPASLVALLTAQRLNPYYKGPRNISTNKNS